MALSNFVQRSITGAVFVLVLMGSILYGQITFVLLFAFLALKGTDEFYGLALRDSVQPQRINGLLLAALLYGCFSLTSLQVLTDRAFYLIFPAAFIIFLAELYTRSPQPFRNIAYTLLGVVYVALPFALLNGIVYVSSGMNAGYHPEPLLGYFFILWASDTGAYLVGRKFGKTKLFERVSPKKTWEGTLGGAIAAIAVAFGLSRWMSDSGLTTADWMVIAVITVVIGSLGDLVESLFKRSIDVKDSGTLLPGHGGILDRFDGLLISAPFIYAYLQLIR